MWDTCWDLTYFSLSLPSGRLPLKSIYILLCDLWCDCDFGGCLHWIVNNMTFVGVSWVLFFHFQFLNWQKISNWNIRLSSRKAIFKLDWTVLSTWPVVVSRSPSHQPVSVGWGKYQNARSDGDTCTWEWGDLTFVMFVRWIGQVER